MKFLKMLTKKNMKLNKKRTIVTIIGVILSVALITAVADMYMTGVNSLVEFEKSIKGAFHYSIKAVDYEDLSYIENNRQVKDYAYIKSLGFAELEDAEKPYANIVSVAKDDFDVLRVNVCKGKIPSGDNEVLIPENYKNNDKKVEIGDTITLDVGQRTNYKGDVINYNSDIEHPDEEEKVENDVDEENGDEKIINAEKKEYKVTGYYSGLSNYVEAYGAAGFTFFTTPNSAKVNITEGDKVDVYVYFKKNALKESYDIIGELLGIDGESLELVVTGNLEGKTSEDLEKAGKDIDKAKYSIDVNAYLINLEIDPIKGAGIEILQNFALIISLIVVAASVFCIKNSFDISVTEKTKQYGMLRSVGATKAQLRFSVLYEAYYIGMIGIPLGVILGLVASFILSVITNTLLPAEMLQNMKLTFIVSIPAIIFAVVLAIITILLSSFGSARRATKISPIESIRNSGDIKIKGKKLKVPFLVRKTCGIGGELSYKNLKRNKKKYRTTIIAMVITIICFIILNSVVGWLYKSVRDQVGNDKYNISGRISYEKSKEKNIKEIAKFKGVDEVVYAINLNVYDFDKDYFSDEYMYKLTQDAKDADLDVSEFINQFSENSIEVNCVDEDTFKDYAKKIGKSYDDIKDGAIYLDGLEYSVLNEKTARYENSKFNMLNLKAGDELKAKVDIYSESDIEEDSSENPSENPKKDVTIKISALAYKEPDYMKSPYSYSPTLILSEKMFKELFADTGYDYDVNFYIACKNDTELSKKIDDFVKDNYSYNYINDQNKQVKMIKNLLLIISIFLYGFIIVVTLIGITSIFNTITTSIRLRAQEFAMLKSVGMTKKEFKRMIRLESIFMGMKALFYGLILGIGASIVTYKLLGGDKELGYYTLPYSGIGISIVAVIVIVSIIMGYAVKKNSNQNIIETIRNENI